jgi:hypothetical protein
MAARTSAFLFIHAENMVLNLRPIEPGCSCLDNAVGRGRGNNLNHARVSTWTKQ